MGKIAIVLNPGVDLPMEHYRNRATLKYQKIILRRKWPIAVIDNACDMNWEWKVALTIAGFPHSLNQPHLSNSQISLDRQLLGDRMSGRKICG